MNGDLESSQQSNRLVSSITLHLPDDIAAAIAQLSQQSQKDQTQLLIDALRQGLGLSQPSTSAVTLEQLVDRLTALESLPQKVKVLEAKVNRLVASKPSPSQPQPSMAPPPPPRVEPAPVEASQPAPPQDQIPSASAPVASPEPDASLETCPKCDRQLGAPLKATGRQVCAKCGWTNKPRSPSAAGELPPDELRQLLDQAAINALTNMKPKGKQNPDPSSSRFPFFGK